MRTTTIKDQGLKLPIGELRGGQLHKDFTLRPYKGKLARALNAWREANTGLTIPHLAAKYLSLVVESAGGVAYALTPEGDSTPEQQHRLHNWFWGDFMYVYVYSRIINCTEWITLPVTCESQKCKYVGHVKGDLWSTEVTTIDDPKELHAWIVLRDGMRVNGKLCKRIKLQPVPYRAMLLGPGEQSVAGFNYAQLREAIVEVEGAPEGYVIQDADLDELSHFDILRVDRQAGHVAAGVQLKTPVPCPQCGMILHGTVNWGFDPFFDSSVPEEVLKS